MIEGLITNPVLIIILALVILFGVAIGEELMFRGYILRLLESNLSFWTAAFASSISFGVLHSLLRVNISLNEMIAVGVSATAFGMMFSYAFLKTGRNLLFPIIIHATWNFGIFIFNTEFYYNNLLQVTTEILSQIVAAFLLVFIIFIYVKYYPVTKKLLAWKKL
jgi:membrane protease YdiL (CAAX protease family)